MDGNETPKTSILVLVLSIIGLLLGVLAFLLAGAALAAFVAASVLPSEVLAPLAGILSTIKYSSYAAASLTLGLGLAAVFLACIKKTRKALPFAVVVLAFISIALSLTGRYLKIFPVKTANAGMGQMFMMDDDASITRAARTPLMKAAKAGKTEEVARLLQEGANPLENASNGWTACSFAVRDGHMETVKVFLLEDAIANDKSCLGDLLNMATDYDHTDISRLLLKYDADLEKKSSFGGTALMHAVDHDNEEIVGLLLEKGADVNAANFTGWTVLMMAAYVGNTDTIAKLLNRGADINARGFIRGATALMAACEGGQIEAVKLLLSRGADMNMRDNEGRTALAWAGYSGNIDIVRLLQSEGAAQ
ncbi:MAG: ankyrin repeat domain-containing protein [Candidatus Abyssobacteria bacterium SURF_5]|uniref:Ankyrin repeat domain-containing protein n=1 Tax=Abyssobacteria bacterium (strain SURF_5) TaxID=2093360 RepID=A0A3A4NG23_ABYX5|nr:MAG: ankyrin repeat domain-containing protein [Candidatus Abyssubacteria bacterium SURF_5]